MCGVVGIYSHQRVAEELFDSLIHLQHRGQDAAGALTYQQHFHMKRGLGLVREVFNHQDVAALPGNIGIGHTRYPTAGGHTLSEVQPIWIDGPQGVALAHNGNLLNYKELLADIAKTTSLQLSSSTDSEALLHMLAQGIGNEPQLDNDEHAYFSRICDAVQSIFNRAEGSFSVVSVLSGKGLLAFRDPYGIRPLVLGERVNADGTKDYMIASETTMFYALGFTAMGDLLPGEVIFINLEGTLFRRVVDKKQFSPCIFEYVYFARPDSMLDGVSVYRSRLRMGQNLARLWKKTYPDILPDIVIPAPFTSNTAALAFAHEIGVRYSEGLYKNPFIGRTFIMADGKERSRHVRYKLTPQSTEIKNKKVLILDDSIVRGTTSREIVKMVREYHATAVYFASACPPIINPCFYGIDMPSRSELVAANNTPEQIRDFLGVDLLLYQEIEGLVEAVTRRGKHHIKTPCMACMNGKYVTGNITEEKIQQQGKARQQNRGQLCGS